jgi:hypothetical protein
MMGSEATPFPTSFHKGRLSQFLHCMLLFGGWKNGQGGMERNKSVTSVVVVVVSHRQFPVRDEIAQVGNYFFSVDNPSYYSIR